MIYINSFENLNQVYDDNIIINENATLKFVGILNGNIEVKPFGSAEISGIVNGNIIALENSTVNINGMIHGAAINKGGNVFICGTVTNAITESGSTNIMSGAIVNNQKY